MCTYMDTYMRVCVYLYIYIEICVCFSSQICIGVDGCISYWRQRQRVHAQCSIAIVHAYRASHCMCVIVPHMRRWMGTYVQAWRMYSTTTQHARIGSYTCMHTYTEFFEIGCPTILMAQALQAAGIHRTNINSGSTKVCMHMMEVRTCDV